MKTMMFIAWAVGAGTLLAPAHPAAAQTGAPVTPGTPPEAAALERLAGLAALGPALAPLAAGASLEAIQHALAEREKLAVLIPGHALAGLERLEMLEAMAPQNVASVDMALASAKAALAAAAPALESIGNGAGGIRQRALRTQPNAAWAVQDPADSLYRAARESLNRNDYSHAADLFAQIIRRYPRSEYTPDAYYWQAFALYRKGDGDDLRTALQLLEQQRQRYPNAATLADADALAPRIQGRLGQLGDEAAARSVTITAVDVEGACSSSENEMRTAALNALLQMDAERAMPILKKVLARRDECSAPLRRKAVFLVSQKASPETGDILLDLARNDPDAEVREQAVFWLSQVDSDRAVQALREILRTSSDQKVQEKALFALSQHRSAQAASILREYATRDDTPRKLRETAIFWIGQNASAENARFLRDLYGKLTDNKLKEKVIFSLSQMHGQGNERWLMQIALDTTSNVKVRKNALFWAGQSGVPIAELTNLYDRMRGREMKEQLIFVYSQRGDRSAVDKLIAIARGETDTELRKKAIFWLGQSNDPRAAEALLEIINHD